MPRHYPSELLSFWVAELKKVDLGEYQQRFNKMVEEDKDGRLSDRDCEFLSILYSDYT